MTVRGSWFFVGGMNSFDPFSSGLAMVVVLFLLLLAVATILMPLYVISMHGLLKEMRKLNKQMDEKLHQLVWYAKQRHDRGE